MNNSIAGVWVKASERLPIEIKNYYLRISLVDKQDSMSFGWFGGKFFKNHLGHKLLTAQIEWLDESHPTPEDWKDLRSRFFKECTDNDSIDGVKIRTNLQPHHLFDWFKENISQQQPIPVQDGLGFSFADLQVWGSSSEDTGIVFNHPEKGCESVFLKHTPTGKTGYVQLNVINSSPHPDDSEKDYWQRKLIIGIVEELMWLIEDGNSAIDNGETGDEIKYSINDFKTDCEDRIKYWEEQLKSNSGPIPVQEGLREKNEESENGYYDPSNQYQRLFNAISDANKIPLVSEMQEIIRIVHEDFPKDDSEKWTDELVEKYAEMYRFSSGRTSIKQFKEKKTTYAEPIDKGLD